MPKILLHYWGYRQAADDRKRRGDWGWRRHALIHAATRQARATIWLPSGGTWLPWQWSILNCRSRIAETVTDRVVC